jgi:hypothetical protein
VSLAALGRGRPGWTASAEAEPWGQAVTPRVAALPQGSRPTRQALAGMVTAPYAARRTGTAWSATREGTLDCERTVYLAETAAILRNILSAVYYPKEFDALGVAHAGEEGSVVTGGASEEIGDG